MTMAMDKPMNNVELGLSTKARLAWHYRPQRNMICLLLSCHSLDKCRYSAAGVIPEL